MAGVGFLVAPNVRPGVIERREYQERIASAASKTSTLVVLSTALGKTVIAAMVIARRWKAGRKALMLAPTKPLVEQHAREMKRMIALEPVVALTGERSPGDRAEEWSSAALVVATPQALENDVKLGRLDLRDVEVAVFDEAHRAVGEYAYVDLARGYRRQRSDGLVLGMTASPGSEAEHILEVCEALGIQRIEIRADDDPDVAPYVPGIAVRYVRVDLPKESHEVIRLLKRLFDRKVDELRGYGFLPRDGRVSIRDLIAAQRVIQKRLAESKQGLLYSALVAQSAAMKLNHAIEMCESQGKFALLAYLDRLTEDDSKATRLLLKDDAFRQALKLAESLPEEHPKEMKVAQIVESRLREKKDSRIIVFTHYRDTAENVASKLQNVPGAKPARFVGQASKGEDRGLKQKEQVALLEKFRDGEVNVLVATSVGEEGLDIPSTDCVIFYEPVPSEIRTIQRRGRTGRRSKGEVFVLMAAGTRDEGYFYSSRSKEKRMREELDALRQALAAKIEVGGLEMGYARRTGDSRFYSADRPGQRTLPSPKEEESPGSEREAGEARRRKGAKTLYDFG